MTNLVSVKGLSEIECENNEKENLDKEISHLAENFKTQFIKFEKSVSLLWCSICTEECIKQNLRYISFKRKKESEEINTFEANKVHFMLTNDNSELNDVSLVIVGKTKHDILSHCATRSHLLAFEHQYRNKFTEWCPVELNGHSMLLDHHCLYPSGCFGNGRVVVDRSVSGGVVISNDICEGVKLIPFHKYVSAELLLSDLHSSTCRFNQQVDNMSDVASIRERGNVCVECDEVYSNSSLPTHMREDSSYKNKSALTSRYNTCKRQSFVYNAAYHNKRECIHQCSQWKQTHQKVNRCLFGEIALRRRRRRLFTLANLCSKDAKENNEDEERKWFLSLELKSPHIEDYMSLPK